MSLASTQPEAFLDPQRRDVLRSEPARRAAAVVNATADSHDAPAPIRLRPRGNKLIVELVVVQERAIDADIVVKADALATIDYGRIIAVGPRVDDHELVEGVVVVFGKHAGFAGEDETTMTIRQDDVQHIVEGGVVRTKAEVEAEYDAGARQGGSNLVLPQGAGKVVGVRGGMVGVNPGKELR